MNQKSLYPLVNAKGLFEKIIIRSTANAKGCRNKFVYLQIVSYSLIVYRFASTLFIIKVKLHIYIFSGSVFSHDPGSFISCHNTLAAIDPGSKLPMEYFHEMLGIFTL